MSRMRRGGAVLGAAVLFCLMLVLPALPLGGPSGPAATPETAAPAATPAPTASPAPTPADAKEYRAVWVSYLEWQGVDFSSQDAFAADVGEMLDNIAGLGANVVLAHVRPFGDALYPSTLYPFSHLCTGTQGQDPGFDPLAVLVQAAHDRGLELEAWINPYRLQSGGTPSALADTSPANTHPDWVKTVEGGLYLDPANPEVQAYIAAGIEELCQNYAIDGVHFDDYFYPTTAAAFDADDYAAYCEGGGSLALEDWRRENVDALVSLCCQAAHKYGVRFGIAPQGDPNSNYNSQYSDTARWLREAGFVDYLMPQLYWGLDYKKDGDASHSLTALASQWLALERREDVALYFGLGAYRIGEGDGGDRSGPGTEWQSGGALAAQADELARRGGQGIGLYRYDSLFKNTLWPTLAAQEAEALRER